MSVRRPAARVRVLGGVVALLSTALLIGGAGAARAADPVSVSTSDITYESGHVKGLLTVTSKSAAPIDPSSLKAVVDDEERSISITQAKPRQRTAMLVIDTSGSMGRQGMFTVREATKQYLKEVPSDVKVGVVSFASTAGVDLAPTLDRAAVQRVVNGLVARGDTSLYAGMTSAVKALGGVGDRSIVLLSDGADTVEDNPAQALKKTTAAVNAADVRVDVVRFRSNDPDAAPALRAFAKANGGTVVSADNTAAVVSAFRASAKALETQAPYQITVPSALTGRHTIELTGVAGSTPFTIKRTVDFSAVGAPAPAATPKPAASAPAVALGAIGMPDSGLTLWAPWLAALAIGLAAFLLATGFVMPAYSRRQQRVASIEQYVDTPGTLTSRSETKVPKAGITDQLVDLGDRIMKDRPKTSRTMELIDRADLPFRAGEWFVLRIVAVIVGLGLMVLLFNDHLLLGLVVGLLLGLFLPPIILRHLAKRRAHAFERILPEVLMLVATSLRSGFGLPQALDGVARDASEPVAKEFSRALAETRIGTDVADALDHVATRMDSTALRWAVMAIRIQREVGGNLADTLMTTAQTLRGRESLRRQIRALSAEGRLSAAILVAIPIGLFFYMTLVNNEYVSLLWTNVIGIIMLIGAGVMMIIGVFWMRKIVNFEA